VVTVRVVRMTSLRLTFPAAVSLFWVHFRSLAPTD
jgi:hypothetical protein